MINHSKFVYTIYIRATPEKIWNAITNPVITRQYWAHENISNWKEGSEWLHVADDSNRIIKLVGIIVKAIPNKLLMLTWADPMYMDDDSTVTIEIEPINYAARLRIIHNNFKNGSKMFERIKDGWPKVLSSMKSFLETEKPLKI